MHIIWNRSVVDVFSFFLLFQCPNLMWLVVLTFADFMSFFLALTLVFISSSSYSYPYISKHKILYELPFGCVLFFILVSWNFFNFFHSFASIHPQLYIRLVLKLLFLFLLVLQIQIEWYETEQNKTIQIVKWEKKSHLLIDYWHKAILWSLYMNENCSIKTEPKKKFQRCCFSNSRDSAMMILKSIFFIILLQ